MYCHFPHRSVGGHHLSHIVRDGVICCNHHSLDGGVVTPKPAGDVCSNCLRQLEAEARTIAKHSGALQQTTFVPPEVFRPTDRSMKAWGGLQGASTIGAGGV